jgi:hypothetical protein
MRKARFTEHKVITFLKSVETEHIVKDDWRAAKGYLRTRTITGKQSLVM